jgi:hypothetical protein
MDFRGGSDIIARLNGNAQSFTNSSRYRVILLTLLITGSEMAPLGEAPPFARQIAPILQAKCLGCHSAEKAKGGYRMHTFDALMTPGKSKEPPITPGKPEQSELFKRITSTDPDERMPQKDDPLPNEQIEAIREWITAGAKLDFGERSALLSTLVPPPPHPAPPERYRRPLPVIALAFTPDGRQLAASGYHEVTFWNLEGNLVRRLTNVAERVRSIAFSPDPHFVAVGGGQPGRYGELSIYNLETGARETNLLQAADEVLCVAFSADGRRLACAGTDNAIHVYDWEKRAPLVTIQQHADWVTSICFNTNGTQIASASRDRTARIYDSASGELEITYTGQNSPLYVIGFLPGGRLISGGRDKALHIWDGKEGKKKSEISGTQSEVYALLIDEDHLFIAGASGLVREYSTADLKEHQTFKSPGDAIYALAYVEGSHLLASGSYDGVINVWNTQTGALDRTFVAAPGWSSVH